MTPSPRLAIEERDHPPHLLSSPARGEEACKVNILKNPKVPHGPINAESPLLAAGHPAHRRRCLLHVLRGGDSPRVEGQAPHHGRRAGDRGLRELRRQGPGDQAGRSPARGEKDLPGAHRAALGLRDLQPLFAADVQHRPALHAPGGGVLHRRGLRRPHGLASVLPLLLRDDRLQHQARGRARAGDHGFRGPFALQGARQGGLQAQEARGPHHDPGPQDPRVHRGAARREDLGGRPRHDELPLEDGDQDGPGVRQASRRLW